jgi:hypothetical protein
MCDQCLLMLDANSQFYDEDFMLIICGASYHTVNLPAEVQEVRQTIISQVEFLDYLINSEETLFSLMAKVHSICKESCQHPQFSVEPSQTGSARLYCDLIIQLTAVSKLEGCHCAPIIFHILEELIKRNRC